MNYCYYYYYYHYYDYHYYYYYYYYMHSSPAFLDTDWIRLRPRTRTIYSSLIVYIVIYWEWCELRSGQCMRFAVSTATAIPVSVNYPGM